MTKNEKQSINSDEIDLVELLAKIVIVIKNNTRSLVVGFLIGCALGLAYFLLAPATYESKMILLSDILTESYSQRITESLDNLIEEDNTKTLSERLGITEDEAEEISTIEIESVKQESEDEKAESSIFVVTIKIKENTILPKLEKGIVEYLRNNEFVKIRVNQRLTYYNTMIEKIGLEINSLDSLKKRLFLGQPIYSKSAEMMLVDPTNIYSKIIELNREQINLKNSLELVNSIQLVEGFTIFDKPASPKLLLSLVGGASVGLFFVVLIIAFKALRKIISLSEEKLAKS